MHICVHKQNIIGSDNGLSPDRQKAIIWSSAGKLLIGPLGTNFSKILIEIQTFSFKKRHLKLLSGKWQAFCLGFNMLRSCIWNDDHVMMGASCFRHTVLRYHHPQGMALAFTHLSQNKNGCYFADDIFKCISMNEKFCILIKISLKFVPKGLIDNKTALVQVLSWCRSSGKPLPEPMLIQFLGTYMWH